MSAWRATDGFRRFVRRPVPWLVFGLLWGVLLFASDVSWARSENRRLDDRIHATGTIDHGWDGVSPVPAKYIDPGTGDVVSVEIEVANARHLPAAGTEHVELRIDRRNPTDARLASDRLPTTLNLPVYFAWVGVPMVLLLARCRHAHRVRALLVGPGPTYAMTARVIRPRTMGWRWRLQLFPLDARNDAEPVCTVVLATALPSSVPNGPRFSVEVKGLARPFGCVVARNRSDGEILWPVGRALLGQ